MSARPLIARAPDSLAILARQSITRWLPIGQKFSGGVYFHLDHEDQVLLATNNLEIQRWQLAGDGEQLTWKLAKSIPIAATLNGVVNATHRVIDVMADWQGNYWFITRGGLVGVIDRQGKTGTAVALRQGNLIEGIDNALAVGKNRVFVVSNHAMYSFAQDGKGAIVQQWRERYDRGNAAKPGTMAHGSGTTPTLIGNDYVAITDSPMGKCMLSFMRSRRGRACRRFVNRVFSLLTKAYPKILLRWWATA